MEVHHHAHTARKKWTHYFWEFLMLFLAVFCGFLAENQREHYIEHQREKELAKALFSEFLYDSIAISEKINLRLQKEKDLDYLSNYFIDSSFTEPSGILCPALTTGLYLINIYAFEPKDGILNQLRNSGSLRYFKSMELQKLFGDISICVSDVRKRNDQEYQFFSNPVKPFLLKHYNFRWLDKLRNENPNNRLIDIIRNNHIGNKTTDFNCKLQNVSAIDRFELSNMIIFYKQVLVSTRSLELTTYINTNKKILAELRHTYNFK